MAKKKYVFLSVLLLVAGCESYMHYPGQEEEGRLYLECFPGTGCDSTVLMVFGTYPVNSPGKIADLDNVVTRLSVNSSPIEWGSYQRVDGGLRFAALTDLSAGDVVDLVIQDANGWHAQCFSKVPEGPAFSYSRELTSDWSDRYHISLNTSTSASGECYYGISLVAMGHNAIKQPDGSTVVEIVPYEDLQYELKDANSNSSLSDQVDGHFFPVRVAGRGMIVFEVGETDETPFELVLETPNIGYHYVWARPDVVALQSVYYRLEVFRLSPSAYHFLNPRENVALIGAGLVPPTVVRGNVKGAYGMFECLGRSSTEWLPGLGLD